MPLPTFAWLEKEADQKNITYWKTSIALYVHWPFCLSLCPYCDFNSHLFDEINEMRWQEAYLKELSSFIPLLKGRKIASVFFGGGTPSLMPPEIVKTLLQALKTYGAIVPDDLEVTLEANPTSVEAAKLSRFREAGITRVSLGIQSLNAEDLRFLGRKHSVSEALNAIALAKELFPRYSFDLIYARPGQTLAAWQEELSYALTLAGDHLSLYQLTIEKGTPFFRAFLDNAFTLPDEEEAAALYEFTGSLMEKAGLPFYEVSNYAKPGAECRHNLVYWHYADYIGLGPGAHSRVSYDGKKYAIMMTHKPEKWLQMVESGGAGYQQYEEITEKQQQEEMLLMNLRLREGITHERWLEAQNIPLEAFLAARNYLPLIEAGLIILDEKGLRLTSRGFPVLNAIIEKLVMA